MEAGDKWAKLEEIVRRVIREELQSIGRQVVGEELGKQLSLFGKKPKIDLVGGRFVGITEEQREAWLAAYGAIDLDAELKRAAAWCVSNPHLAPKSQIGRFLNSWLLKSHNAASLRSIPTARPAEVKAKFCEFCGKPSTGNVSGYHPCDDHWQAAMDGVKPMGLVKRL